MNPSNPSNPLLSLLRYRLNRPPGHSAAGGPAPNEPAARNNSSFAGQKPSSKTLRIDEAPFAAETKKHFPHFWMREVGRFAYFRWRVLFGFLRDLAGRKAFAATESIPPDR